MRREGRAGKGKGSNASQEKRGGGKSWRRKVKGHEENKGERQTSRSWGRKRQKVRGGLEVAEGGEDGE